MLTWIECAPLLRAALAHAGNSHRLEDLADQIAAGAAQLWRGERSVLVTVVEDEPCGRRLVIWLGGGELHEVVESLVPAVERWGRAHDCRRVLIMGRAGWERALRRRGYAPLARIIGKDLG